ncbi:unnamed protein product [Allacma fusca]|uniref:BRCA1-associated RING domain protein 1 n=1 Tax=Allacma fusca TaxID=39272 RepID=A0A8J2PBV1_9HEXA|nr:unnamed protein product [Allacma fusca]
MVPVSVSDLVTGTEDGRLSRVFEMLDLLKCVSCSDLPFEKVWTPGNCCHKYCKSCLLKLSSKECIVCQIEINPKDREVDLFSTNLITQLLQLQRAVDPDSEYNSKKLPQPNFCHEASAVDVLYEDEGLPKNGGGSIKNSGKTKPLRAEPQEAMERNDIPEQRLKEKNSKSSATPTREPRAPKISRKKSIDKAKADSEKVVEPEKREGKGISGKKGTLKVSETKRAQKTTKPTAETLTGEMLAKLFASSSSEDEELPSLTPHRPTTVETERISAVGSKAKTTTLVETPKERPQLEVQVTLERIQSPSTRSRSRAVEPAVSKSRRSLGEEFGADHKKTSITAANKPKATFVKPEPIKRAASKKFFRSTLVGSNSEDDSCETDQGRKVPMEVKENKKQRNQKDTKERACSPADDIYDFQSQSKKVILKKKGKGVKTKRMRLDSDSSTASSVISNVSVKKEKSSTPKTNKSSRQNSSIGSNSNHAIKNSPGINKRNAKGETVLHIAVRTGKLEKVKDLIENGAEIDAKDFAGWAPLHEAINAKTSTLEMVQLLCNSGADVNALGMSNETPLHEASRLGLAVIVKYLLSQSASAAIRNSTGRLPVDCSELKVIKKIFRDHEEEMSGMSQSNDISVELKISLQKAVLYFAYNVSKDVLKNVKAFWDVKISQELTNKVTHVIFDAQPKTKVPLNFDFLLSILNGTWILSSKWLEDSLSVKRFLDPRKYQLNGCVYDNIPSSTGDDVAVERARVNREHGNPSLFQGINFYIYKNTNWPTNVKGGKSGISLSKKDIGKLIKFGEGVVINREPNPDMVDPLETPLRFHARHDETLMQFDSSSSVQEHKLSLTSHVILYDDKNVPPTKHDLEHVKTLKIDWLIHSAVHFRLLHPDSYL